MGVGYDVDWHGPVVEFTADTHGSVELGPHPLVCTICHRVTYVEWFDGQRLGWIAEHQHPPTTKDASKTGPASDAATDEAENDVITP